MAALLIILSACGGSGEGHAGDTGAAAPADPAIGSEPSTGTDVALSPPETAPAGDEVAIPLVVTVGRGEGKWDSARLDLTLEGPVSAQHDFDLSNLQPGGSVAGHLRVTIDPGDGDALNHGSVTATLVLLDGDEVVTARLTRLGLMADDQTTWMGLVGRGDLERARLRALLDVGVITQKEFDQAYAETLEQTTGAVERKDD
jgi:hypothetical protein